MHALQRKPPTSLADYLEVMTRAAFQSGLNWRVIDAKWDGFCEAFEGFDPAKVAAYTPADVERLVSDTRIVRNHKKIEATIANAGELIVVDPEYGGFAKYLDSFEDYEALVKDLRTKFHFLGETGSYYFLYVVGVDVPHHEEWMKAHHKAAH